MTKKTMEILSNLYYIFSIAVLIIFIIAVFYIALNNKQDLRETKAANKIGYWVKEPNDPNFN